METKKDIRKQRKELRGMLNDRERREKDRQILQQLLCLPVYQNAEEIYCYVNCAGEVGTRDVMLESLKLGKKVAAPKVCGKEMTFLYVNRMEELTKGAYGILEPKGSAEASGKRPLLIMPCVAFDEEGNRLGYGGGYYDRYLAAHPGARKVLLAYELQKVRRIPAEPFDRKPEWIVTEKGVRQVEQLPKDPMLLLSVVNTKLRDYYPTLETLCEEMGVSETQIRETLHEMDYVYDRETNQFV